MEKETCFSSTLWHKIQIPTATLACESERIKIYERSNTAVHATRNSLKASNLVLKNLLRKKNQVISILDLLL